MELLILEDNAGRNAHFRQAYPSARIVETAHEAIDALRSQAWDYLSLDHDLSGEIFVDSSRDDCGMGVVRWLIANPVKVEQIMVHTANHGAANLMGNALKDAGYNVTVQPFGGQYDPRSYMQ